MNTANEFARNKLHHAIQVIVDQSSELLAGTRGLMTEDQVDDILRVRESAERLFKLWATMPDPEMLNAEQRRVAAHNLKNLLNGVTGYTLMLLDNMVGELTDQQREVITEIYDMGMVLLDTITTHYSRPNSCK